MSLSATIKDGDWTSVRQAIKKLDIKLGPTSTPTFGGLTLTGLTASRLTSTNSSKELESVSDLTSWVAGTANQIAVANDGDGTITLSTPQDIHTGASPTFANITATGEGSFSCIILTDLSPPADLGVTGDLDLLQLEANLLTLNGAFGVTGLVTLSEGSQPYTIGGNLDHLYFDAQTSGAANIIDLFTTAGDGTDDVYINFVANGVAPGTLTNFLSVGLISGGYYVKGNNAAYSLTLDVTGALDQLILGTDGNIDMSGSLDVVGTVDAGTMTIGSGSITDSSGAIDFGNETLNTSSYVAFGGAGLTSAITINSRILYSGADVGTTGFFQSWIIAPSGASGVEGGHFQAVSADPDPQGIANAVGGFFEAGDWTNPSAREGPGTTNLTGGYFSIEDAGADWTTNNPTVVTRGIRIATSPTGYGSNHTHYSIYSPSGNAVHGGNLRLGDTAMPTDKLEVVGVSVFGDGGAANFSEFEADGTYKMNGTATVWNDMQFQISDAKVTPASLLPSWETFTTNTSEYAFSVNDEVDTSANEIPHSWKQGTAGSAHLHITTKAVPAQEEKAQFTITFAYADTNEVWVEAPLTAELTIPISTTALTNLYLDLGDITLTNYLVGAQMRCRVKRIAKSAGGTEYVGDIFITQVGIHFEEDTIGSRAETTK